MFERSDELIARKFREYLLPTILTSLAMSLASVVDSVIVGNLLGDTALAAVGLSSPLIYCINFIYMLFGVGGMTLASIARGQRQFQKSNDAFTLTIVLGTAVMFAFLAMVLVFLGPITEALADGDSALAAMTADYVAPLVFTGPGLMFSSGMALFIRTDGSPRSSAAVVLIANAVNLVLDYVLIAFAGWGIAGAGASTSIGYAAGALIVVPYLLRKDRSFRFVVLTGRTFRVLPELLKTGMPKALIQITSFFRQIILNSLILGLFGAAGMTVMSVCINVLMISNIFVTGTSDALLPIAGTLYGEQDLSGIRATMRRAAKVVAAACGVLVAFFMLFPGIVGSWFGVGADNTILEPALRFYAMYLPLNAANVICENFYTTTGRTKIASTMAALDGFVYVVPFAFLLAPGGMAFWLCFFCSGCATLLTAVLWTRSIAKKEHLNGMLLLPAGQNPHEVLDVTIRANDRDAVEMSQQVVAFCEKNGVEPRIATRLGVCVEEMAVNTAAIAHAHNSEQGLIDLCVRITPDELIVRFRDDGSIFDPATYEPEGIDGCTTDGIAVMKKLATKTDYARQLGFNTTVLTFSRSVLRSSAA